MGQNYKVKVFPTFSLVRRVDGSFYVSKLPNEEYVGGVPRVLGEYLLTAELRGDLDKGKASQESITEEELSERYYGDCLAEDDGA